MRNAITLMMVVLLALTGACRQNENKPASVAASGEPQVSAQSGHELTPEQLGEIGAQIRKTPDHANELLSKHGLTPQSFEAQIRKITENPDASKRYAAAYRKASA